MRVAQRLRSMGRSPRAVASVACALLLVVIGFLTVDVGARATRVPLEKTTGHNGGQLHLQMQQMRRDSEVAMSTQEMALVEQYLGPDLNMLEWGSGHSTMWFSQFVRDYYSIEHHEAWAGKMAKDVEQISNIHYKFAGVPDGHKGWSGTVEEGNYDQFEEYIKAADSFNVPAFDRVLVDGRARVACLEYILRFLHPESLVFVHDFMPRSYYWHAIGNYYKVVAQTFEGQSIVVARPRPEFIQAAKDGNLNPASFGQLA